MKYLFIMISILSMGPMVLADECPASKPNHDAGLCDTFTQTRTGVGSTFLQALDQAIENCITALENDLNIMDLQCHANHSGGEAFSEPDPHTQDDGCVEEGGIHTCTETCWAESHCCYP